MGSIAKEVKRELFPFLRIYNDGSVERLIGSPIVPPPQEPETGVSSKDITISENPLISARIYLPKLAQHDQKLPLLVYYHGGAFCIESAFSLTETKLLTSLVSEANIAAISIEYRRAPEHPLPIAYHDCWAALHWVASHSDVAAQNVDNREEWLSTHVDYDSVFVGGDSAGANLAHNMLMRAGKETLPGEIKISKAFLTHPYFWGSKPVGSEPSEDRENILAFKVWDFLYPSAGIDNPMMNPMGEGAPSLAGLGCSKMLVEIAELDELRNRGVWYYNGLKDSGWKGEVELVEVEGEDHAFHILNYESEKAKIMIKRLASFLSK